MTTRRDDPARRRARADAGFTRLACTRITAPTVLELLAAGDSIEDLLDAYPTLTREDVLARLRFASRISGHRFNVEEVA